MTFKEKLAKLIGDQNRTRIAQKAGVPSSVVTTYVNRGSEPSAANALKLARALDVPLEWLVDDERDWPPPHGGSAAVSLTELRRDLGGHMHAGIGRYLLPKFRAAEETPWAEIGRELASIDPAKPLPPTLRRALILPLQIRTLMSDLGRYDPLAIVPADDPAEVREATEANADGYTLLDLIRREEDLQHGRAYGEVFRLVFVIWTRSLMDNREQLAVSLDEARQKLRDSAPLFERLAVEAGQFPTVAIIDSGVDMEAIEADIAADEEVFRRARSSERATRQPRI